MSEELVKDKDKEAKNKANKKLLVDDKETTKKVVGNVKKETTVTKRGTAITTTTRTQPNSSTVIHKGKTYIKETVPTMNDPVIVFKNVDKVGTKQHDGKAGFITRAYVQNPPNCSELQLFNTDKTIIVPRTHLYRYKYNNLEYSKMSDKQKFCAELLFAKTAQEAFMLTIEGVDLKQYTVEMEKNLKYVILIPKDSEHKHMPVLSAHFDTVHYTKPTKETLKVAKEIGVWTCKDGLGADDRSGLYIINQVLRKRPKDFIIALFDLEESGCVGSSEYIKTEHFRKQVNAVASCYIGLDRKGHKEAATYGYDSSEMLALIKKEQGRIDARGSSTDVAALSRGSHALKAFNKYDVCCVNYSVGYYNQHQKTESIVWSQQEDCLEDILTLPKEFWEKRFDINKSSYRTNVNTPNYNYNRNNNYQHQSTSKDEAEEQEEKDTQLDNYEESIIVDSVLYQEDDVQFLLNYFLRHTGKKRYSAPIAGMFTDIKIGDYVKLARDITPNCHVGGFVIDRNSFVLLAENMWKVKKINPVNWAVTVEALFSGKTITCPVAVFAVAAGVKYV